jgi:hypothetical protein
MFFNLCFYKFAPFLQRLQCEVLIKLLNTLLINLCALQNAIKTFMQLSFLNSKLESVCKKR